MVQPAAPFDGGEHTRDQAQHQGQQQRAQRQLQRGRKQGLEFAPHRGLCLERLPQVPLRQLPQITAVLHVQRLVQTEAFEGGGVQLRVERALAHHHFDWVAGDQTDQGKSQQRDAQDRGDQHQQLFEEVSQHEGAPLVVFNMRKKRAGAKSLTPAI
ncbi:hypothetical protein FQZ97_1105580 [compost metagenome]